MSEIASRIASTKTAKLLASRLRIASHSSRPRIVTIDARQRQYLIPMGTLGWDDLGFDVALYRCSEIAAKLKRPELAMPEDKRGTLAGYQHYLNAKECERLASTRFTFVSEGIGVCNFELVTDSPSASPEVKDVLNEASKPNGKLRVWPTPNSLKLLDFEARNVIREIQWPEADAWAEKVCRSMGINPPWNHRPDPVVDGERDLCRGRSKDFRHYNEAAELIETASNLNQIKNHIST